MGMGGSPTGHSALFGAAIIKYRISEGDINPKKIQRNVFGHVDPELSLVQLRDPCSTLDNVRKK
jgi:hypothetical protein